MKIYVDKKPKNCEECILNDSWNKYTCALTGKGWVDETPESMGCPLKVIEQSSAAPINPNSEVKSPLDTIA